MGKYMNKFFFLYFLSVSTPTNAKKTVLVLSDSFQPGLNESAANRKWGDVFANPATRKDQVDAVSEDGKDIGKAT